LCPLKGFETGIGINVPDKLLNRLAYSDSCFIVSIHKNFPTTFFWRKIEAHTTQLTHCWHVMKKARTKQNSTENSRKISNSVFPQSSKVL
jgi:hypothetical protein